MFEQDGELSGTVDLRLQKGGRVRLVQCRQWQSPTVDVSEVRELFEAINSEQAAGGIIISSGTFTPDAKKFAAGKSIELMGVEQLTVFINIR